MITTNKELMLDLLSSMNGVYMVDQGAGTTSAVKPSDEKIHFLYNTKRIAVRVYPHEIACIRACRTYCDVYFKDGKRLTVSACMRSVFEDLAYPKMLRISRFSCVNTDYIESLRGNLIKTTIGLELQVTPGYKASFDNLKKIIG
jgi:DNA-binding LytR/AlgR family response regulator